MVTAQFRAREEDNVPSSHCVLHYCTVMFMDKAIFGVDRSRINDYRRQRPPRKIIVSQGPEMHCLSLLHAKGVLRDCVTDGTVRLKTVRGEARVMTSLF